MPSAITLDITDGYSPSVMFPRETFFWRVRIRRWFRRCFRRWVVFFICDRISDGNGITDECYTDGRDPSVTPSVLLLSTEFIDVTDGISPSAKLYNVVVLYWLTKYFKKLSYFYPSWTLLFSSCDLGGDWCLGVGLYFYVKWKTCNVTKSINIICMQKKKRYIEYGFALQRVAMIVTWCFIIPTREFIFISVNL
jgi:hypothetical protein